MIGGVPPSDPCPARNEGNVTRCVCVCVCVCVRAFGWDEKESGTKAKSFWGFDHVAWYTRTAPRYTPSQKSVCVLYQHDGGPA